jgi:hypothetical protein
MKRLLIAIALGLAIAPNAAGADEPPAQANCEIAAQAMIGGDPNKVTIACYGINDAFAEQLIGLAHRMLRDRINPQTVLAKLDEVERVPEDGVARTLDDVQRQVIIQSLHGQDAAQIMITAHPNVDDSAGYAKDLATPLLMAGWQIEGHQVRRTAPKALEPVQGVAIVVRDTNAPPKKAQRLKAALTAAKVTAPFVSDPRFDAEATMLWIGKRPGFMQADAAK